ncbi:MAG TPA: precorrin-2 C(20)-methyltransferase [Dongiaceae bacterium]|jgi:precorrin-2/cobalt-factor-2 C20-methyltransferase
MSAQVYGLGVGPGDPELLTLKALRLLRAAPVIAYPAPDSGDSFARSIVAPHLPGGQKEIAIRMPLGDGSYPKADIYDRAARDILAEVRAGRDVAVLCEGDPFFYGSFMYLHARLARECAVTIVPGVSSLMACAAMAGVPLSARNESLIVVPAPLPDEALQARLSNGSAAAIVKVGRHLSRVRNVIESAGRLPRALLIERATLAEQRVRRLADVEDDTVPYFSMILVAGEGVS